MKRGAKRGADVRAQGPGIWLSRGELAQHFELAISTGLITEGTAFEKYNALGVTALSTDEFVEALGRGFGVGRPLGRDSIVNIK